jgi:NADH-ubiquinone oxidoreductase chain 4
MKEDQNKSIKQIALIRSLINFIISIVLWAEFDSSSLQYQFVQEFNHLNFCHFPLSRWY